MEKAPPLVLLGGADAHDLVLVEMLIDDYPNIIFVVLTSLNPIMNTTRVSNFFIGTRVVSYSESLAMQGFPLFYVHPMHIRKHQNCKDVFKCRHRYMNMAFRYSYLDMLLQTLVVSCISAFDGGELHCKNGYIHPHSFESAAQKYIHAGRPPLF